jgi:hypothetical protein
MSAGAPAEELEQLALLAPRDELLQGRRHGRVLARGTARLDGALDEIGAAIEVGRRVGEAQGPSRV